LSEHHEDRDRVADSDRDLTETEAGFYGTEPGEADAPDPGAPDPERDRYSTRESYRASGAAARARAPARETEPPGDRPGDDRAATPRERVDGDPPTASSPTTDIEEARPAATVAAPLFPTEEADSLRTRWDSIQTEFVDEPRTAVEKADSLVGDVMQRLADGFSHERSRLEKEWDQGESVSTEDLRVALKRYRSFFDRLLSV
jgi:hypothetical protein